MCGFTYVSTLDQWLPFVKSSTSLSRNVFLDSVWHTFSKDVILYLISDSHEYSCDPVAAVWTSRVHYKQGLLMAISAHY